jgi:probable phosphoglycerate mutase
MVKSFFFIRHGQTDYNRNHIVQGSGVDSVLNEMGRMQARQFYEYYKDEGFELVISSKLKRSIETVQPFIQELGIPHQANADINEISWGVHEGKTGNIEMKQAYDDMIKEWQSGNYDACLKDAESARELSDRCTRFISYIKTLQQNKVLICSHGRTLRCLMCLMKGQHLREMENYGHHNVGLFQAEYNSGQFRFLLENDVSHRKPLSDE